MCALVCVSEARCELDADAVGEEVGTRVSLLHSLSGSDTQARLHKQNDDGRREAKRGKGKEGSQTGYICFHRKVGTNIKKDMFSS